MHQINLDISSTIKRGDNETICLLNAIKTLFTDKNKNN